MNKIGRPDLVDDPDYATPEARLSPLDEIFALIEEWTIRGPSGRRSSELNAINVPCGPVLSTKDLIEDEGLRAEGMIVDVEHPERGTYHRGLPVHAVGLAGRGQALAAARRAQRRDPAGAARTSGGRARATAAPGAV